MDEMPVFQRQQFQENLKAWSHSFDELVATKKTKLEDLHKTGIFINRTGQGES